MKALVYLVLGACLLTSVVVGLSSWQLFRFLYVPVVSHLQESRSGFKLKRTLPRANKSESGDFYGELRLANHTLVVGAPFQNKEHSGAVYVQSCEHEDCVQDQLFVGAQPGNQLGTRLAISGDGHVIAAYADQARQGAGSVSLFRRISFGHREWRKVEQFDHPEDVEGFGSLLALDDVGHTLQVGAQEDRRVWTYVHVKGRWHLRDTRTYETAVVGLACSKAYGVVVLTETGLHVDGARWWTKGIGFRAQPTMIAVGTHVVAIQFDNYGDAHGTVLLFANGETTERLQPESIKAGDAFGVSCAISEDDSTIVVGSSVSSRTCVFRRHADSVGRYLWVQELAGTLGFGRCVGLARDGSRLYVSSNSTDKHSMSGDVYYYEWLSA